MSMRDLVGGDCSGSNSMLKFTRHADSDRSVFRDRPGPQQAGPSQQRMGGEEEYVREFFSRGGQGMERGMGMQEMGKELGGPDLANLRGHPAHGPSNWASEFQNHPHPQFAHQQEEFDRIFEMHRQNQQHLHQPSGWEQEFMGNMGNMQGAQLNEEQMAHFERMYQSIPRSEEPKIQEVEGDLQGWSNEFVQQNPELKGKEKEWADDFLGGGDQQNFEEIWKQVQQQAGGELHFGDEEEEIWDNSMVNPFGQMRVEEKPYEFETNNPFLEHPNAFQEGLNLMENGNLSDAVLAFEAAVQKDPKNVEGWFRLGTVQQENEKESPAISALRQAVTLDPSHMPASLALSVSFTNEGAENQALDALENWIKTKYPNLNAPLGNPEGRHDHVVGLFLQAVRSSKEIDPEVQVGLGVLFNISCEYDKAVDCFNAALQVNPQDYIIWNRLGATLANGGRSEEAISAYHKALEMKPSFVRARYNLGVSCINIGCYREAAEHFLAALALHGSFPHRNVSANLWDTLRRTFLMMDRRDLFDKAQAQEVDAFRPEFDF